MEERITVGLVEDQFLFRKGMKAILSSWQDLKVVFESEDGYSVLGKLKEVEEVPQVMLVDLSLPPDGTKEFTGKEVTQTLRENFPDMKIIILSVHKDEDFIAQLIECGAHGYLVKDCDPGEVYEAITSAFHRGSYINARTLKAIQNNINKKTSPRATLFSLEQLTKREEEVLQLICMQLTTEEIAERLFISPKTVNGHRNSLLQKTGANNVAGLVIYAVKNGVIKVM
ncbi:MAG: response regulator transcription factor [Bacteroidetes bacterium]|nr:response regulator transcription factor [Bacteroidota bacterium]